MNQSEIHRLKVSEGLLKGQVRGLQSEVRAATARAKAAEDRRMAAEDRFAESIVAQNRKYRMAARDRDRALSEKGSLHMTVQGYRRKETRRRREGALLTMLFLAVFAFLVPFWTGGQIDFWFMPLPLVSAICIAYISGLTECRGEG